MSESPFSVEPYGGRWAVVAGGEVLILARSRRAAETLMKEAAKILTVSAGMQAEGRVGRRPDPRAFLAESSDPP